MNIYHSYYRFWRNFEKKNDFCWIAITKTFPIDYVGNVYRALAPIGRNFEQVENPFNERQFFIEYSKLLKSLDRDSVIKEIQSFSKKGKDIVLLNWEDLTRKSEGRFAFAWMMSLTIRQADRFDLANVLKERERMNELTGDNFLNI